MKIEDVTPDVLDQAQVQCDGASEFVESGMMHLAEVSEIMFGKTATSLALMTNGAALIVSSVDLLYADIRKHMAENPDSPARQLLNDDIADLRRKLDLLLDGMAQGKSSKEILAEAVLGTALTAPAARE